MVDHRKSSLASKKTILLDMQFQQCWDGIQSHFIKENPASNKTLKRTSSCLSPNSKKW